MDKPVFPVTYKWELLDSLRGIPSCYRYPSIPGDTDEGYIVRVIPNQGIQWVGNFFGVGPLGNFSGVYSSPDPDVICVIGEGLGYFVNVNNPLDFHETELFGITSVSAIPELNMLLIVSILEISAYDRNGLLWVTHGIGQGEINILNASENEIIGNTWVPEQGYNVRFSLNPGNGEFEFEDQ